MTSHHMGEGYSERHVGSLFSHFLLRKPGLAGAPRYILLMLMVKLTLRLFSSS